MEDITNTDDWYPTDLIPQLSYTEGPYYFHPDYPILVTSDVYHVSGNGTPQGIERYKMVIGTCYQFYDNQNHLIAYVKRRLLPCQERWILLKARTYSYYHTLHMLYPILYNVHFTLLMPDLYWSYLHNDDTRRGDMELQVWHYYINISATFQFTRQNQPLRYMEMYDSSLLSLPYQEQIYY